MKRPLKKEFAERLHEAQQANSLHLPVTVFAQDERRFGLMTMLRRIITGRGVKPIAPFQHTYQTLYLYGVVEPLTGEHFFFSFSHVDAICFQVFLDQVSAAFSTTFNLILLDQGTFHCAMALRNFASLDELFNAMSAILDGSTHEMFRSLTGFDYVLTAVNGVFI